MKGQRNCQAIRNSVKETVSLLLKNKSYCPSENDSITTSWSSKTFIAYHLSKVRLQYETKSWLGKRSDPSNPVTLLICDGQFSFSIEALWLAQAESTRSRRNNQSIGERFLVFVDLFIVLIK